MFDIKSVKIPSIKSSLPRKRDTQRMFSNKRIREPISAKVKNAVRKRAGDKCEVKKCNNSKYLEFHHKNMKSDDNRPAK